MNFIDTTDRKKARDGRVCVDVPRLAQYRNEMSPPSYTYCKLSIFLGRSLHNPHGKRSAQEKGKTYLVTK